MNEALSFPLVTLLITHYNRSASLERLLAAFAGLRCHFCNIIVSDDGSISEQVDQLRKLQTRYPFTLLTSPVNKGLGNNINKGQAAVASPYVLYVQEDFVPTALFPPSLKQALALMVADKKWDIARFYSYRKYPYLSPVAGGFSEMRFKLWYAGYRKFHVYSDHPQLRRRSFPEKFGQYAEGVKGDVTEYRMVISFLQHRGKALYYDNYRNLFDQVNSAGEPSTMKRDRWRNSSNIAIAAARYIYRHVKFNYDYLFMRQEG